MLSKDEILKKKGKSPQQLDLVNEIDGDKDKTKNRLFLILFLILTVGSSASLWFYREYQSGNILFNFSLPKISTPVSTDKNVWQICLFNKQDSIKIFSQNCELPKLPPVEITNNIDLIKSSLPNGLIINEQVSTSSSQIDYLAEISSPQFSYLLSIKIFGSYPLDQSQNLIPKIAADLYWQRSR
ncbi:MAG: hypothetical protein WC069_04370 [Candidatus Shapirobacteria bacterium]